MRWAIDAGDPRSIASARRALATEIRLRSGDPDEAFAAEVIIGEILSSEMDRGRIAIALELEWGPKGAVVHLYDQGDSFTTRVNKNDLRRALVETFGEYLNVSTTEQGNHIEIAVPVSDLIDTEAKRANPRLWRLASELVARRSRLIADRLHDTGLAVEEDPA